MTDFLKNKIKGLPQTPGVYFFKNEQEEILYIGKAVNIKRRILSHYSSKGNFGNFYPQVADIDYIETPTEKDALVLEARLIHQHQPKYNVVWKDDRDFSFVALTHEPLPRVIITHQPKTLDADILGPFMSGYELRQMLFELRKIFPYRTCKNSADKPCLYYHMGLCAAHGEKAKDYPLILQGLRTFLAVYNGGTSHLECYDISNTQGSLSVGSMVTFLNGKPEKSLYRKFRIRTVYGSDDPRSLREVIDRRLSHEEWKYPDAMIIDGGKTQLSKLKNLPVPIVTIAKLHIAKSDEGSARRSHTGGALYSQYGESPVRLSRLPEHVRTTILAIRDESHRFAITYHRLRQRKALFE
jgi:excinuclease UvrABC nuclease subunit